MLFPFVGKNLKIGRVINLSEIPDLVNSCGFNLSIHSLTHSFSQCLLSNYFVQALSEVVELCWDY